MRLFTRCILVILWRLANDVVYIVSYWHSIWQHSASRLAISFYYRKNIVPAVKNRGCSLK